MYRNEGVNCKHSCACTLLYKTVKIEKGNKRKLVGSDRTVRPLNGIGSLDWQCYQQTEREKTFKVFVFFSSKIGKPN